MNPPAKLTRYLSAVRRADLVRRTGRVTHFFGLVVESQGPDVCVGEVCEIFSRSQAVPIPAEVVGLKDGKVLLMPYGDLRGIGLGSEVIATGRPVQTPVGPGLLGRVIDAFGQPLDGQPLPPLPHARHLRGEPFNPLARARIREVLETGVKAIDALLTVGKGQRVGIFSGSGVGKSTLLGMIARNVRADVNVIAFVGERGREVREFLDKSLGAEGRKRSVVVVATSDQPALVRSRAALTAVAVAEYFREQGKDVVLIMDSITRYAMAQREIGLAIGEPPTARGYTPSVFAALPKLLERCGAAEAGSITALLTVLAEADDLNDPVADAARAILDGNIVLARPLANAGHYPAIDVLRSTSRLLPHIVDPPTRALVQQAVAVLSQYEAAKDLVELGAYRAGANAELDRAIRLRGELERFLRQDLDETVPRQAALARLRAILPPAPAAAPAGHH